MFQDLDLDATDIGGPLTWNLTGNVWPGAIKGAHDAPHPPNPKVVGAQGQLGFRSLVPLIRVITCVSKHSVPRRAASEVRSYADHAPSRRVGQGLVTIFTIFFTRSVEL